MRTGSKPETSEPDGRTGAAPKGKARFEIDGNGLAVQVDRQGFRRLLQTLERLATTGESQTFEKSGRWPRRTDGGAGETPELLEKIVFHIEDRS